MSALRLGTPFFPSLSFSLFRYHRRRRRRPPRLRRRHRRRRHRHSLTLRLSWPPTLSPADPLARVRSIDLNFFLARIGSPESNFSTRRGVVVAEENPEENRPIDLPSVFRSETNQRVGQRQTYTAG